MLSTADQLRARFAPGDCVQFVFRGKIREGTLARSNPKNAVVQMGGDELSVPYPLLIPKDAELAEKRAQQIESVYASASDLMRIHGLKEWRFKFDQGTRRAGSCNFTDQLITLSFGLAQTGSEEEIRETLLHEIAHALAGKEHNHNAVWRAKAQEVGCTGKRTHSMKFAPPRWRVRCENNCWSHTADRRNARLICKRCGGKLIYTPNNV